MSDLKKYDTNQNGVIDPHELAVIELEDRRRKMAWFALAGLLMYPSGIFICDLLGLGRAAELIADIAGTYFIATSALCASFFGASAYQAKKQEK